MVTPVHRARLWQSGMTRKGKNVEVFLLGIVRGMGDFILLFYIAKEAGGPWFDQGLICFDIR